MWDLIYIPVTLDVLFTNQLEFVTNPNSDTVSLIDTVTNNGIAIVPVGSDPQAIVVSPDGTRAYVCKHRRQYYFCN